jgi:hypothetical protein
MRNYLIFILVVIIFSSAASYSADSATSTLKFLPGRQVGRIQTDLIKEASGMVASRKNPGVLWVHNDSGDSARIYAVSTEGELLRICSIIGGRCRDWEDIAIGPGPDKERDYLYIGDIGDNDARHKSVTIYRVPEPKVDSNSTRSDIQVGPAEAIELLYPDGSKDAETLIIDPVNGDIYIISKRKIFCRVYRAGSEELTERPVRMSLVAILPWALAVGGDISPDGKYIIVRSLSHASLWIRQANQPLRRAFSQKPLNIQLMPEPQGEAICFDAEGKGFFTTSEKAHQPIYYFERSDESNKSDGYLSDLNP